MMYELGMDPTHKPPGEQQGCYNEKVGFTRQPLMPPFVLRFWSLLSLHCTAAVSAVCLLGWKGKKGVPCPSQLQFAYGGEKVSSRDWRHPRCRG